LNKADLAQINFCQQAGSRVLGLVQGVCIDKNTVFFACLDENAANLAAG
jgi:hypothetical protein